MTTTLLGSPVEAASRAALLVQRWRDGELPVFVMGKNAFAGLVVDFANRNQLPIAGLIATDLTEPAWRNVPRRDLGEVPVGAVAVNCVPDGRTITVQKQILRANLLPLTYFELSAWSPLDFPLGFLTPPYTDDDEKALAWVMERLEDAYSRDTLARVLKFRSSFDVTPLAMFPFDIKNQYIESFVEGMSYRHLIDGGAYDGSSTLALLNGYPSIRSSTLFEPNVAMHASIHKLLAGRRYELIGSGLWSVGGQRRFTPDRGPTGAIDDNGTETITVSRLDDFACEDATLIKLDVEGAELEALRGASRTIVEHRPGLAVAAYHNNRHFYEIPQLVLGLRPDYRMRLRHYTEGRLETIYYFL